MGFVSRRWGAGLMVPVRYMVLILAMALPAGAQAQSLPDYESVLVNDFADILSPDTEAQLATMLQDARNARDHEMTVVTIARRADYGSYRDIAAFSKALFNAWGVGNAERNDGIVMVVAVEDRDMRIALGSGYPARYDGIAKRIIDSIMLPAFRTGDMERGVLEGTRASLERLDISDPAALEPTTMEWLQQRFNDNKGSTLAIIVGFTLAISALMFLLPGLIARGIRGIIGNWPRKCPECGRRMLRLGDVQEDQYLDAGQRVEEQIKSIDYGVWICSHDEHVTVKGYPVKLRRAGACPECGYHTCETSRFITKAASYTSGGEVELTHRCANCDYEDVEVRATPPKERKTHSSSSGFSSSSSSRGFGGGRSSGGGASGSW